MEVTDIIDFVNPQAKKYYEYYNEETLFKLYDFIPPDKRNNYEKYYKAGHKDYKTGLRRTAVKYYTKMAKFKNGEQIVFGRQYPQFEYEYQLKKEKITDTVRYSFTLMDRFTRGTLCDGLYYDLDFVNSHPILLKQFCEKKNIDTPILSKYINSRDKYLNMIKDTYKVDRRNAKKLPNTILNGGSWYAWAIPLGKRKQQPIEFIIELQTEFKERIMPLFNMDTRYQKLLMIANYQKKQNPICTAISYYIQDIETKCLNSLAEFLEKQSYTVSSLIYDGLLIRDTRELKYTTLKVAENYIEQKTEYRVKLKIKNFEEKVDLTNVLLGEHTKNIAELIMKKIQNRILPIENRYFYLREGKYWVSKKGSNAIQDLFCGEASRYKFIIPYINKKLNWGDCSSTLRLYREVQTFFKSCFVSWVSKYRIEHGNFNFDLFQLSNIGKLCFKNGVYDFKTKEFTRWYNNKDIYSLKIIDYNFPKRPKQEVLDKIKNEIFNVFPDEETMKYYLKWLARSLAGHSTDKRWGMMVGDRDSGKGVIQVGLEQAFQSYVDSVDTSTYSAKRTDGEAGRKFSWVLDKIGCRLLYSNEATNNMCGVTLKNLSSGSDTISVRPLFTDKTVSIVFRSRMLICLNESVPIKPINALYNLDKFCMPYRYCLDTNPKPDDLIRRKKDPLIKDKLRTKVYRDAILHIVLDSYKDKFIPLASEALEDAEFTEEQRMNKFIGNYFIITNNINDKIPARKLRHKLNEYLDSEKLTYPSSIMITNMINKGVKKHRHSNGTYYKNIKFKDLDDENEE